MPVEGGGNAGGGARKPAPATRPDDRPGPRGPAPTPPPPPTRTTTGDTPPAPAPPDPSHPSPDDRGGSKGTNPPAPAEPIDWSTLFTQYGGMPQETIDELNRIFSSTPDINQAILLGQAYIRGTNWYSQTFPGIQAGINAGLFSDEQGYRGYQNQINQLYQQYYGRVALPAEVQQYVTAGQSVSRVAAGFQGDAIYGTLSDPLKNLFTDDERHLIANEQAGIDTPDGAKLNVEANLALKVGSLYKDFYGRDMTRDELNDLTKNGLSPEDVAKQFATEANIDAMDPTVKALFSQDEIHQIALSQAGGITEHGESLANLAKLAQQLNPLYSQYNGQGISRDEVNQAFSSGETVTQIGQHFAGDAFIKANKQDIQQVSGQTGDGQLSDQQLKQLGDETAGYDTPQGQVLASAFQKAQQRLAGAFKGKLATAASFQPPQAQQKQPDVAA